jgi:hypothetical protein
MSHLKLILVVSIILVASALVLAQNDTAENAPTILPAEDIIDEVELLDITDDGARVHVISTLPLACSVVYGPTREFGQLSVDADMGGGAHEEHNALLINLEPDTLYYYRFQGSDANGNLYVSDVMTFRTLPASEELTENLASPERGAQIVGVSSNFGGQPNDGRWGAVNAFDGNAGTAWSSAGDGDDAWVEVELAERSRISRVEFWTRSMSDGSAQITSFTITTDDGEVYGPFELSDAEQSYTFEVEIEAKTLRFDVETSSGGNTGAVEIAVYGEPAE